MTLDEKYELACSLRKSLIESVSKTGGHIASNLGIVELTNHKDNLHSKTLRESQ